MNINLGIFSPLSRSSAFWVNVLLLVTNVPEKVSILITPNICILFFFSFSRYNPLQVRDFAIYPLFLYILFCFFCLFFFFTQHFNFGKNFCVLYICKFTDLFPAASILLLGHPQDIPHFCCAFFIISISFYSFTESLYFIYLIYLTLTVIHFPARDLLAYLFLSFLIWSFSNLCHM